jgi:hypothetical protein
LSAPTISKDSTVYSYTLVKKIPHNLPLTALYWAFPALWLIKDAAEGGWASFLSGWIGVLVLQSVLMRICLFFIRNSSARYWSLRFGPVWTGFLPNGFVSLPWLRRLHLHAFWAGLAWIGALYPWLPGKVLQDLVFFHLWIMAPRLMMMALFRKKAPAGWLKISGRETSCYTQ